MNESTHSREVSKYLRKMTFSFCLASTIPYTSRAPSDGGKFPMSLFETSRLVRRVSRPKWSVSRLSKRLCARVNRLSPTKAPTSSGMAVRRLDRKSTSCNLSLERQRALT